MFLVFLTTFLTLVNAIPYECTSNTTINLGDTKNGLYVFPSSWNYTSNEAPEYDNDMDCLWTFYVPQGSFAHLKITGETPSQAAITVINCAGNKEIVPSSAINEPYFFVTPMFRVLLTVTGNVTGTLGFTVEWRNIPKNEPRYYDLANDPIIFSVINTIVLTSTSRVSLIASSASDIDLNSYLRMFAVFDGCNTNATYLANLKQVASSRNQLISSGKSLTIVNLIPGSIFNNYFVVQDYENVKHFNQYKLADCMNQPECSIGLDARDGTAGLVSVSPDDRYINNIENPSGASALGVYYGANYTGTIEDVPQKFNNYMTTITLSVGSALLEYSTQKPTGWQKAYDKRKGFFASKNFGSLALAPTQDVDEILNGKQQYLYGVQIYDHGLIGNATLRISTYEASGRLLTENIYNSTSLPSINKASYQCSSFAVTYKTNGEITTGFNMAFEITQNTWADSSSNANMMPWFALIILFFMQ